MYLFRMLDFSDSVFHNGIHVNSLKDINLNTEVVTRKNYVILCTTEEKIDNLNRKDASFNCSRG